jgi:hypothetical protein
MRLGWLKMTAADRCYCVLVMPGEEMFPVFLRFRIFTDVEPTKLGLHLRDLFLFECSNKLLLRK